MFFANSNRTTGLSPRRDLRRKLCRSPYFMKGRMTMGFGKCSDSTSKHTPERVKVSKQIQCIDLKQRNMKFGHLKINSTGLPRSPMTFAWLKSFMHAASFRNSSISLWEKLSTKNEKKAKYNVFSTQKWAYVGFNIKNLTFHRLYCHFFWRPVGLSQMSLHHGAKFTLRKLKPL